MCIAGLGCGRESSPKSCHDLKLRINRKLEGEMKKTKFTESQIIGILKEQEQGKKMVDICREHGISQPTFYQWKSKYSGMDVNQLKRVKELETEVAQYKKIVAEQTLDIRILKDLVTKKF
jgi:putative transposase